MKSAIDMPAHALPGSAASPCQRAPLATGGIEAVPGSKQYIAVIDPEVDGGPEISLRSFTSSYAFIWQKPDAGFRFHLNQWLGTLPTGLPASNDSQHVTLITVVRPDGRQQDLTQQELLAQQPAVPTHREAAK